MFTINWIEDLDNDILEISGSHNVTYAKIHLNLGGSLQELILNGHHIIKDLRPLTYDKTYASSILFPFANRVANGVYRFDEKNIS
jgi:aldose 1-epimerase